MKAKKQFKCNVENCDKEFYAKGYCRRHYNQMKYSKRIKENFRNDKNKYIEIGDKTAILELYDREGKIKGKTMVDTDDLEKVKQFKWYLTNHGYVMTTMRGHKNIFLHRFLMNCPDDKVVDHINHDITDNRKSNLRICTQKENMQNLRKKPKCITKINRNGNVYYILQITGKYLGCFKDKEKAIIEKEKYLEQRSYLC